MFLDDFTDEEKYTATFESRADTISEGVITEGVWSSVGTADCLLWDASMSKNIVSDRYKDEIDSIAVFNYDDISFTIPNNDGRVTINSKVYAVLESDNIANQNEIIQVYLKQYE